MAASFRLIIAVQSKSDGLFEGLCTILPLELQLVMVVIYNGGGGGGGWRAPLEFCALTAS